MPDIWLITGIPGAGKTTTALALARALPKSAAIHGDDLHDMVISSNVAPGQQPKKESGRQLELCVKNQCLLANSFYDYGVSPVIDWVVADVQRLRSYQRQLQPHPIHFVMLNVSEETALKRDAGRDKQAAETWLYLRKRMHAQLSKVGYWLDTDTLSVSEIVDKILQNQTEALIVS